MAAKKELTTEPRISLLRIKDGDEFEDLVAAYFRNLSHGNDKKKINVEVQQSGVGTDGGRDILVSIQTSDLLADFQRRWVVQCKFHQRAVSPSKVSTVNIPTLIHSYGANGYLLIVKRKVTSGLTNLFEKLNQDCKFKYHYIVWEGKEFEERLYISPPAIHDLFFPNKR